MSALVELGELMPGKGTSVDPTKFPNEEFALFSIPAYELQVPDRALGREIGSSKQVVLPGDVLLSKIVPHIRRAWIVPESDARRQIGSSEWIVFRSPRLYPPYLRHVLLSDQFNSQLMQTVSGVGGSLLRARPAGVSKLRIPIPSLDEQRRIAAILDKAEELRAKRRAAIALLDQLPQAIFLEMFGDMNARAVTLGEYTERVTKGTTPTTLGFSFTDSGIPLLRAQNLREDRIDFTEDVLYIARDTHLALARSQIRPGDVLTTIAGTIGRTVIVPGDAPEANCNQAIAIITPKANLHGQYLRYWLSSPAAQRQISQGQVTATISNLSLGQIKGLTIPLPNLELQQRFASRVEAVQRAKTAQVCALFEIDALFSSLQESAFGGHP